MLPTVFFSLALIAVIIWVGLLVVWGQFWRADQRLSTASETASESASKTGDRPLTEPLMGPWPAVAVIIPARNEADLIATSVRSHLTQSYLGPYSVVVVDDNSSDETVAIARQTAQDCGKNDQLTILSGKPLPSGWTGKLWAMQQGFQYLAQQSEQSEKTVVLPDYILFTDADIQHHANSLKQLVTKAETDQLDLVSLMVKLRCDSTWEKLLIPAFIFFFQMLYPFPWVNNPLRKTAAAAGGCALIRFSALTRINGLEAIRQALIDDCALGAAVKAGGPIWLGLSSNILSLRPYPNLSSIWQMVTRSAYTQLNYSPWLLIGTVFGMGLVYAVSPLSFLWGVATGHDWIALLGLAGWLMMAIAYWPTLKLYDGPIFLAFALPFIALLYTLMTLDSARLHQLGQGGAWKGRTYEM